MEEVPSAVRPLPFTFVWQKRDLGVWSFWVRLWYCKHNCTRFTYPILPKPNQHSIQGSETNFRDSRDRDAKFKVSSLPKQLSLDSRFGLDMRQQHLKRWILLNSLALRELHQRGSCQPDWLQFPNNVQTECHALSQTTTCGSYAWQFYCD